MTNMARICVIAAAALFACSPLEAFARGGGAGHGGHSSGTSSSSSHVNSSSHYARGYFRQNGTYVQGYHATNPNGTKLDNYSTRGNFNPWTSQPGTKSPDTSYHPHWTVNR
jgi:hypothetical protein